MQSESQTAAREMRVLLAAVSARPGGHRKALEEFAAEGCDWASVLQLADKHGLGPLAAWLISETLSDSLPAEVLSLLRQRVQQSAGRNLTAVVELRRIFGALNAAGVPAILLKGLSLAERSYGNLALREFADLDVLIDEAQLEGALAALREAGYCSTDPPNVRWLPGTMETSISRESSGWNVDLHWRLLPRYFGAVREARLRAEPSPMDIAGSPMPVLGAEAELVFLAANGARECWSVLRAPGDIAYLVRSRTMDWRRVEEFAADARTGRALSVALLLAERLFDAPVPAAVLRRAESDRAANKLAGYFAARLLSSEPDMSSAPHEAMLQMRQLSTVAQRLGYAIRRIFEPSQLDAFWLPLPRRLTPAYYFLRPVRVSLQCARQALRLLFRSASPSPPSAPRSKRRANALPPL